MKIKFAIATALYISATNSKPLPKNQSVLKDQVAEPTLEWGSDPPSQSTYDSSQTAVHSSQIHQLGPLTHLRSLDGEEKADLVVKVQEDDEACENAGWDVLKKICCGEDMTPYDAEN